jgi:anthranilate synthase / indole-3-glycerol phosphate synthase
LSREGARVDVFRNDKITPVEIEKLNPDQILISPGPGHPTTDAGVSNDVIKHFAGKIPIFGVCLGEQCMITVFGGEVGFAGEIVHGKTSTITHDNKGLFRGISQNVAVTRYHSLAGRPVTIPDSLEVTARNDSGIIMGVRHKEYTIEGVQFHPESILTEEGRQMVRNMLSISGGHWSKEQLSARQFGEGESILDRIFAQRRKDVAETQALPGRSFTDLERNLELGLAPRQIDFVERLKSDKMALMAEIKRASPSKGPIGMDVHAPTQAVTYAKAGAAAISVLTEPHWFKGSIEDLRLARLAVDKLPNRPAILRKEFVFDEYQILEARLAGADTVLLIVKMLDDVLLQRLYKYSLSLGMEPLVEVASGPEMECAIALGARAIGVNNRDLHSFAVDLNTTSSLVSAAPEGTVLAALSGISGRADVEKYAKEGVSAILVGEALMKAAPNTVEFVDELLGR